MPRTIHRQVSLSQHRNFPAGESGRARQSKKAVWHAIADAEGDDAQTRYIWTLTGPEGAVAWQAGPITMSTESITRLMESEFFSKNAIDGIPWIGWDLGIHAHEKSASGWTKETWCHVLEGPCWFDGGTALGAEKLLELYVSSMSDEAVFEVLEGYYESWLR